MKKIMIAVFCLLSICLAACGRDSSVSQTPSRETSDSSLSETTPGDKSHPDSSYHSAIENCTVLADDYFIDQENRLFFYRIDSKKDLLTTQVLEGAVSVIPYATRYTNESISDVLTQEGNVYSVDWMAYNPITDNSPRLVMSLKNVSDMKKIVGCNLFLKNDNSLWTFTNTASRYDHENWPLDSSELDWHKVADDVVFAASSANGELLAVQDKNGRLYVLRNSANGWQDQEVIATDVKESFSFFYPANTGEYGLELYYTDSSSDLYRVVVTEETAQPEKVDEQVNVFASYYDMNLTHYQNNSTLFSNGNDGQSIQFDMTEDIIEMVLSEKTFTEGYHQYLIRYGICLNLDGNAELKAFITDLGEVNPEGI